MDELQISGKRFISSRRIARENGYTSDYIGQLIRGGKVAGQKVGRAWYVDALSFDVFLGEEGAPANPAESTGEMLKPEAPDQRPSDILSAPEVPEKKSSDLLSAPQPTAAGQTFFPEPPAPLEKIPEPVVPVVVEEVVEEEITPSMPELAEEVQYVPLRITKPETSAGLHYYADETPSLPEIRHNKSESRIAASVEYNREEPQAFVPQQEVRRPRKVPLVALAAVGVAVFIFSAVLSSAPSLNLSIEGANPAAVSYGFNF